MSAEFVRTPFGSALYRQNLFLRQDILRAPLGLALTEEDVVNDAEEQHFCALLGGAVVACVQLKPAGDAVLKLRQMAVVEGCRGCGIGAGLVKFAEAWARNAGFDGIMMHARATAIGFYEKLGYAGQGEPFDEHTIPHVVMMKVLV